MNDVNCLKYNYVVFFAHEEYQKAIIGQSLECIHIYDWTMGKTLFGRVLSHIYWSYSLRTIVKMPLKKLMFNRMYTQSFDNIKPLCFIYLGGNSIRYDDGWCEYVRRRDPRNKQVVLHSDLISKKLHWDYEELRNKMDLCVTYDKGEAEKYGIHYFDKITYNTLISEEQLYKAKIDCDVYYLASVKDRFSKIMDTYHYLVNNGVRCKFILVGVPLEQQIQLEGIEYSAGISYKDNLKNVIHTKCILELTQGSTTTTTLRAIEAIAYHRRLITDCTSVNRELFNNGQLQVFNKPEDIDISLITSEFNSNDYPKKIDFNPINRLIDIEQALESYE